MPARTYSEVFQKCFYGIYVDPREIQSAVAGLRRVEKHQIQGLISYACNLFLELSRHVSDETVQAEYKMCSSKILALDYEETTEEIKEECLSAIECIYNVCSNSAVRAEVASIYQHLKKKIPVKRVIPIISAVVSPQDEEELGMARINW